MPQSSNLKRFKKFIGYILTFVLLLEGFMPANSIYAGEIINNPDEIVLEDNDAEEKEIIIEEESEEVIEETFEENSELEERYIEDSIEEAIEIESGRDTAATPSGNVYPAGTDVTVTIVGDTLTVSGNGPMKDYRATTVPWNVSKNAIKKIVIDEGVTSIGLFAFDSCVNLESVKIASTVTNIGNAAFSECNHLTKIEMPLSAAIDRTAFSNVYSLSELTIIPSSKPANYTLTTSTYTPWYMSRESTVDISIDDAVTKIGDYSFYDGANKYQFGTLKLDNVDYIGDGAFFNCKGISEIILDNTSSPIEIGQRAFKDCSNVTDIKIPVSLSLNEIEPFAGIGNSLTAIDITKGTCSGTDYRETTYKNTPWYSAQKDLPVTIEDGITYIGNMTFNKCEYLSNIALPDSVTEIGTRAFLGCKAFTTFRIPSLITEIKDQTFAECSELTEFSNMPSAVTSFGNFAFYNCKKLNKITIPLSIGKMYRNTFCGCSALEYENLNYESTTKYHRWYTTSTYKTEYDLQTNLIKVSDPYEIFLKNSDDDPIIPTSTYAVSFKNEDESVISINYIVVPVGTAVSVNRPSPDPVKTGYTFVDWYEDKECIRLWDFSKTITGDVSIYAKWKCAHLHKEVKHINGRDSGKDPACGKTGIGYEYCTDCNDGPLGGPFDIPSLSHNYVYTITKAPTPQEKGRWEMKCTLCGAVGDSGELEKLVPELPIVKVDDYKYRANLVVGGSVMCPDIAKGPSEKAWRVDVDNPRITSVSKKGQINGLRAGTTTAYITMASIPDHIIEVEVIVKKPTFLATTYLVDVGEAKSLGFGTSGDSTGLETIFDSSNPNVVTVDAAGTITGVKVGSATITVKISGQKYATCKVKVQRPVISEVSMNIIDGKMHQLKVTGTKETLNWHVDDESILRVSNGRIYPKKSGYATVYVDVGSRVNALSCFVKVDYPILDATKKVVVIEAGVDPSFDLSVLDTAYSGEAKWKSSNTKVLKVEGSGGKVKVTPLKAGNAVVYCDIPATKIRRTCKITVYCPYIHGKGTVKYGRTLTLTLKNGDRSDVVWSIAPGGTGSASISEKGVLRARGRGTVIVEAYTSGVTVRKEIIIS